MTSRKASAAILFALALASCSTPGAGDRYDRLLTPTANPSDVIATELAMAREAQERGHWTAMRKYAGDGALMFGQGGLIDAQGWLKGRDDPEHATQWEPHSVWSSCDGSLAVTRGVYRSHDGGKGSYSSVWERQRNGEYRWVLDFGFGTQTVPEAPERISAVVADCEEAPAITDAAPSAQVRTSSDATLAWTFYIAEEKKGRFNVWLAKDGAMTKVVDASVWVN